MPVTIIVGAQYGGEGKGKIANHLARATGYAAVVRCGGPNSGHTVVSQGRTVVLRQLPAAVVNSRAALHIPAGGIVDMSVLQDEMAAFSVGPERLRIDRNALILEASDADDEAGGGLGTRIGSTCTGTGFGVARRIRRGSGVRLARDIPWIEPYLTEVSTELAGLHMEGGEVLIEGTQGFGLSLYHAQEYPFATSRDTTAAAFLSETGLGPRSVTRVVLVVRTFPIRVAGNSGPLTNETGWDTIQAESGYPYEVFENTSVTHRRRRVARFDAGLVSRAVAANGPTEIAVTGLDYLDFGCKGATRLAELSVKPREFVEALELAHGLPVGLMSTGPDEREIIDAGA